LETAALVAVACGGVTAAAYFHVRDSAIDAASERLLAASTQVEELVAASMRNRTDALRRLASDPLLRRYMTAAPADEAAVLEVLKAARSANTPSLLRLVDPDGHTRLATEGWDASTPAGHFGPAPNDRPLVGPFVAGPSGSDFFFDVSAPIRDAGVLAGYLIERRSLSNSGATLDLLQGLIGEDARLFLGNRSGDVWTDFSTRVASLPPDVIGRLEYATLPGEQALAVRGVAVEGTPWTLAVGLPAAPVLGRVRDFLADALAFTGLIVAAAGLLGWLLSRRLTVPLQRVTAAAEEIAATETDGRPRLKTDGDEIARLAASFSAMAARVEDSHRELAKLVGELEDRVQTRTAALESANKELKAFSYSVSHDLRAPLRAIGGFSQILLEDHGGSLSPEARQCVDVITRRARQMGQLIDDLLAFTRVGQKPVQRQPVGMTSLAAEVVEGLRGDSPGPAPEIQIDTLPPALGERVLLRQLLLNLIQNARKFSATRADPRIQIGALEQGDETVYFVRDNGVGFDMQYADKLFGIFQRLHRPEDFEGTGVGLAIVERIVHQHGGRIWAEAVVDGGATFYFTLPAPVPEAA